MTTGAPLDATRSVTYFTFDQFGFDNFGYAAAGSHRLFLAVVVLTRVQFRWLGELFLVASPTPGGRWTR